MIEVLQTRAYYLGARGTYGGSPRMGIFFAAGWSPCIGKSSLVENFAHFGYAIIALDVAGHIAHNLFHLLAEGKSIFYTAIALLSQDVHGASPALVGMETIQLLQYGLLALGFFGSLYRAYLISKNNQPDGTAWRTFLPYATLIVILTVMNVYLFMLPMAMRM